MGGARGETAFVTNSWSMPGIDDPPGDSVVGTPDRLPGSVRRTSHLSATFPDGFGTGMQLDGRVRDLLTPAAGDPRVLAEVGVAVTLDNGRDIRAAAADPNHPGVSGLVGASAGRGFRAAAAIALADEATTGSPLYFLLDDIAVISGIGGVAWSQHRPLVIPGAGQKGEASFQRTTSGRVACSGLRPDGYHQISRHRNVNFPHWVREAGDLTAPTDAWAWHDIEPAPDVCFRRRRRIDVWRTEDTVEIDAHFRDSVYAAGGLEVALHEYAVRASAERGSNAVRSLEAVSKVLPFPECPWAAPYAGKLAGTALTELRASVPTALTELESCTHLNDMLRGLADVPRLESSLGD
jgi:hypothetical protein